MSDQSSSTQELKLCILGASRGLGRALAFRLSTQANLKALYLLARSHKELLSLKAEIQAQQSDLLVNIFPVDVVKDGFSIWFQNLVQEQSITDWIYCVGGGNHGAYAAQSWMAHQWTLKANFLVPAELIHLSLKQQQLRRITLIGSALAERIAEPQGASYAAAKSALAALVRSLQADPTRPSEIHIFSPGFIDTKLLPKGSWPRKYENLLESTTDTAQRLVASLYPV